MPEEKSPEKKSPNQPKTLEMRVAELEDKLAKLYISEEELKAYKKVSALLGTPTPWTAQGWWPARRWQQYHQSEQDAGGPAAGTGGTMGGGFGSLGE